MRADDRQIDMATLCELVSASSEPWVDKRRFQAGMFSYLMITPVFSNKMRVCLQKQVLVSIKDACLLHFLHAILFFRIQSVTTCLCTASSSECRMKEQGRVPGGCSILKEGRAANLLGGEQHPWITTASLPKVEAELPRKKQPFSLVKREMVTALDHSSQSGLQVPALTVTMILITGVHFDLERALMLAQLVEDYLLFCQSKMTLEMGMCTPWYTHHQPPKWLLLYQAFQRWVILRTWKIFWIISISCHLIHQWLCQPSLHLPLWCSKRQVTHLRPRPQV